MSAKTLGAVSVVATGPTYLGVGPVNVDPSTLGVDRLNAKA
jgi:hypothetical protein